MKAFLSVLMYVTTGLSLTSCESRINTKQLEEILNHNSKQSKLNNIQATENRKRVDNKSEILGVWDNIDHENLAMEIGQDSIYYVDSFKSYSWKLRQDSISILFDDYISTSKVLIAGDTLILISNDDSSRYVRKN